MPEIHPTAIVSVDAELADDVLVGPYAILEGDVRVGAGSKVESHAILKSGSIIGKDVKIGSFSVIAGPPQDLKFDEKQRTFARIGDSVTIREGVTVNRATKEGKETVLGEGCFVMAASHVGHDCQVGAHVVIGNASLLAGHVTVGERTFLGGSAGIHQFCRIGEGVMFGGQSTATMDVAPFTMFAERNALFGLNLVGLRRRGLSKETIANIQRCYRRVFLGTGNVRAVARELLAESFGDCPEARRFLEFFAGGTRGFAKPGRGA